MKRNDTTVIEVLFNEIDLYNAQMKCTDNLDEKYFYAELIGDIVNAIKNLGRYRHSAIHRSENDYI